VRAPALRRQDGAQRALTAGLDLPVRRLEQEREVAVEPAPPLPRHPAETVLGVLDLLVVVEDEGEVVRRGRPGHAEPGRDPEHHRVAGLHVAGATSVQPLQPVDLAQLGGHVVGDRHGVQVPGEDDPGGTVQVGAGQDGVSDPLHLEPAETAQGRLDRVGQRLLRPRHRGRVDECPGELQDVGGQVDGREVAHGCRA
jgi:hypothetical protein